MMENSDALRVLDSSGTDGKSAEGATKPSVPSFDYVVIGGTGDLTFRKLLPALYYDHRHGLIDNRSRIIAAARSYISTEEYHARVAQALSEHLPSEDIDDSDMQAFIQRITYTPINAAEDGGWDNLHSILDVDHNPVRVFYLATAPHLFGSICHRLHAASLINDRSRVVLEKPLGHDVASALAINRDVGSVFSERNIFRIDHYLGKESVQNLLALRFANVLFEPLWNSRFIDHIQITVAETVGLEGRGGYYERAGALRDMVQNHLLQVLCLVAMDPPAKMGDESVRDEKLKILRSLGAIEGQNVLTHTVRGQYAAGAVRGVAVPGYLEEPDVDPDSQTETFVCLKTEVFNWRWGGMPFYLRTGKRLAVKASEIVIQFRPVPHSIFPGSAGRDMRPNRLVVRVHPNEGVDLHMMTKEPGPGGIRLRETPLNLSYSNIFKQRMPDAYERLLLDVVRGNPTLFMRRDEVEAAWQWVEPILNGWASHDVHPCPYTAGTWGPSSSIALIERDRRSWHDYVEPSR